MDQALRLVADVPRWRFDDIGIGLNVRLGTIAISREASIAFASVYDPEPFHLDDSAAAANPVFVHSFPTRRSSDLKSVV